MIDPEGWEPVLRQDHALMNRTVTMASRSDAPHLPRSAPIDAYGNGGFAFAEMSHRGSLLCLPDAIWAWPVTKPEDIDKTSLERVFAAANDIYTLIIGTGTGVWLATCELRQALSSVLRRRGS